MKKRRKVLALIGSLLLVFAALAICANEAIPYDESDNAKALEPAPAPKQQADSSDQAKEIAVPQYEGYYLLWNDEFDGDSLNTEIWNMEARPPRWTNNELQEYTLSAENIFIRDGKLVLKAIKTQKNGRDSYTSGKVNTMGKKDFMYGKVVVSAKVPAGQGLWPAIWMMPTKESLYGPWPRCGEIDIMEVLGNQPHIAYATVHYGLPHAQQQKFKVITDGTTFADDFHEFALEWEPGEMRFYVDGELIHTVNDWYTALGGVEKPYPAPFNQNFYLQLNLAVGGDWPGNPDETTDFTKAEFEIDYVRVYQKSYYDTNVKKPEKVFRAPLEDGNLIYNGDFAEAEDLNDEINWKFLLFQGGEGTAEIKDGMMIIKTRNEGKVDYSVQLVQANLPMYEGKKYRITFAARASAPRDMIVCVSAPDRNWIRYFKDTPLTMTTAWQTYTYEFTMTEKDDNNGRLEFNMGNRGSTADIYIRNVRVEMIK
ncbi:MAG: family 16 glycosylhydrolase [Firmicutes bacterium]|nr:family 16 glycosylhydrolase [Bacillota bacterium]